MLPTSEFESRLRTEPLMRKPTTLPHGILDAGAETTGAGEDVHCDKCTITPTPSTTDVVFHINSAPNSGTNISYWKAFHVSLPVTFYFLVLAVTIGLTLAACKFTNIWDPCAHLYVNSTECKVTSYMKGMIYYTECTEERSCILPGFESNLKRQGWSLHKPDVSTTNSSPEPPVKPQEDISYF